MARLLHIQASPRKELSSSIAAAQEFLDAYAEANPMDEIETLDLWTLNMPEFDGAAIEAKYRVMRGQTFGPAEAKAWDDVVAAIERFKSADKYVFSVPMWNFSIPYKLKQFIDVIVQPGQTFSYSPGEGYRGLVTGRRAVLILSRGGEYSSNDRVRALDFQRPYLRAVLGFIGIADVREIVIEPALAAPGGAQALVEQAKEEASKLAREF